MEKNRCTDKKMFEFYREVFNRTTIYDKFQDETARFNPKYVEGNQEGVEDTIGALENGVFTRGGKSKEGPGTMYDIKDRSLKKKIKEVDKVLHDLNKLIKDRSDKPDGYTYEYCVQIDSKKRQFLV